MTRPKYKINDKVRFFCKYKNENASGEIIGIRESKLNWDYKIRYQIYVNFEYIQWVKEEDIISKIPL